MWKSVECKTLADYAHGEHELVERERGVPSSLASEEMLLQCYYEATLPTLGNQCSKLFAFFVFRSTSTAAARSASSNWQSLRRDRLNGAVQCMQRMFPKATTLDSRIGLPFQRTLETVVYTFPERAPWSKPTAKLHARLHTLAAVAVLDAFSGEIWPTGCLLKLS